MPLLKSITNESLQPPHDFYLRELQQTDNVSALSLGSAEFIPLKTFLKKSAFEFHSNNIAKTYVLVSQTNTSRVWGYLSLMCSEISMGPHQKPKGSLQIKRYKTFPAVKLARLAIDKSLHGKGLGITLIESASSIIRDHIMPNIGCRYFVVNSKPSAVS